MLSEGLFNILRTPELLFRWMELSSVADAVFRSHPGVSGATEGLLMAYIPCRKPT